MSINGTFGCFLFVDFRIDFIAPKWESGATAPRGGKNRSKQAKPSPKGKVSATRTEGGRF